LPAVSLGRAVARKRNFSPWQHFLDELATVAPEDPVPLDDRRDALHEWKARFPARLDALLGPLPERVPLDVEIVSTEDCGSYRREKIVFDVERGLSSPGWLLVPHDRVVPGAAVLAQHEHGMRRGKDEVCGIDGGDERLRRHIAAHRTDYGRQLAERGYVVLAIDLRTFGERSDWNPDHLYACDLTYVHHSMLGRTLLALDLWDLARALDVLCGHPLVDPTRVGMVGLSQGGTVTLFLAAWDERVRAAAVSGYFSSWAASAAVAWNMCGSQVLHGMLGRIEHLDLGAAIAPRPLFVESGNRDDLFSADVARVEMGKLARVYARFGASERLEHHVFDGGHRWNGDHVYPFLDRWL
jgi:dienelactone hydrolase